MNDVCAGCPNRFFRLMNEETLYCNGTCAVRWLLEGRKMHGSKTTLMGLTWDMTWRAGILKHWTLFVVNDFRFSTNFGVLDFNSSVIIYGADPW